ncbi:dihydropteroate synthase [Dolosicoccus paucivorans]|uniref:Dihydropteroate synthase n=1 Tax=Dolosicoccus paucivorans TaxID=84521 RepID=A0A1G8N320_9LACT|nr:dihydropteroate synthase [Dolosicoccus paucivorans]PMB84356.1 dihydropteroate synthase [Dolosicoccus paucivorans]PMC58105.1 dihydropteroate synthase [Dolosicoccus paucivorans]SDI74594.1 dihydropteroate synthase [Dolosicoccus paucivorans]
MVNIKQVFNTSRGLIMGVVNVTPDSFSDGGDFYQSKDALSQIDEMVAQGVDIIDLGAQSTRPGYTEVAPEEEIRRLTPILEALESDDRVIISVDTYFPQVAEWALNKGAHIINDIKGGDMEGMLDVIANYPKAGYIYMHSRQWEGHSLEEELKGYQQEMVQKFQKYGISLDRVCFDPGVGWKSVEDHLALLKDIKRYNPVGQVCVLYGVSRKRFIGRLTGHEQAKDRDVGSITASLMAIQQGANIVRVHNVRMMKDALNIYEGIKNS